MVRPAEAEGTEVLLISVSRADYNGLYAVSQAWQGPGLALAQTRPSAHVLDNSAYGDALALINIHKPKLVVVLGDRRETLQVAAAVVDCGVKLCQLHALEESGHCHPDSKRRRAITRLADYYHHCPCVPNWGGEVGKALGAGAPALALVGSEPAVYDGDILLCYHATPGEGHMAAVMEDTYCKLMAWGHKVCPSSPGLDPGKAAFEPLRDDGAYNSPRNQCWVGMLKGAKVLVGNSSSGIIEAATCGTWVVNVGKRQEGRPQSPNTFNFVDGSAKDLADVVAGLASGTRRYAGPNVYGDSGGAKQIADWLKAQVRELE